VYYTPMKSMLSSSTRHSIMALAAITTVTGEFSQHRCARWRITPPWRAAIAPRPDLVLLDAPTAALDVSVRAVVRKLLRDLKQSFGMSSLFVSRDLNVVRLLCDRVIVMQAGLIVAQRPVERVLARPQAAYRCDRLAAIPHLPPRRLRLAHRQRPRFAPRCACRATFFRHASLDGPRPGAAEKGWR
jgi:ABC-type microcin C transport system duplicated ATPase subunit YejF